MMPLKANTLTARHPRRDPNLSHIMRLGRPRIPIDHVLQLAGEDLAIGVAGETRRGRRREDEDDGAVDVRGHVGGYPALVVGGFFVCCCRRLLLLLLGFDHAVVVVVGFAMLAFFGLVAFECEGFDHDAPLRNE